MVNLQQSISKGMVMGMAVLCFRSIRAVKYMISKSSCFLVGILINFEVLWILNISDLIG